MGPGAVSIVMRVRSTEVAGPARSGFAEKFKGSSPSAKSFGTPREVLARFQRGPGDALAAHKAPRLAGSDSDVGAAFWRLS
jgi:hypothetical protein